MTNIAQYSVAKAIVAFVAAAMIFTAFAAPARAQSVEDLQKMIADLMAQITALQGGTPSLTTGGNCAAIPAPLTIGAQNANVTALQNFLISSGGSIPAGATGYFGTQTQSALAAWQAANGVAPAVGYYGPITAAAMAAKCVPVTPVDPVDPVDPTEPGTTLGDDEGDIVSSDKVSADEANLEEGTEGGVLAFTLEIEGDVEIDRLDVFIEVDDSTTASDDADDYFTRAFLMVDGEEVAELDVDEFDDDDYTGNVADGGTDDTEYRLRFSGLGLVFADGDEPEMQIGFEVVRSLDSNDLGADWDVEADVIRFVDGKGFTDTFNVNVGEDFGFDAEEVAELSITKSSDSEDARTIEVDTDDNSSEFPAMILEIEEENGVDVVIDTITMTASTTNTDVTTTIEEVILVLDGEEIGSDSPNASGALEFDNLDLAIDADDMVEVAVHVVFKGTDDYAEGDQAFITFNAVTDAKDANGNDEGDITGSNPSDFSSDTFTLRSEGIAIDLASTPTAVETAASFSGDFDSGVYTFKIDVTAFGDDFYFDEQASIVDYDLIVNGVAVDAASSTPSLTVTGADAATTADFKVGRGETVTLTFSVKTADDVAGTTRVQVNSVAYSAADDNTEELSVTATPATDWRTSTLILN